mgnify:CR=1 FL=1
MQIHVISPGESLFGIAQAYNTTANAIVEANRLPNPNQLVVGQALVIPIVGRFHWVQPGESLWQISQRYQIPVGQLADVNQIQQDQPLAVGTRLYIPTQLRPKPSVDVGAYVDLNITGAESPDVVEEVGD